MVFSQSTEEEDSIADMPCPTELRFEADGKFAGQAVVQMRSQHDAEVVQNACAGASAVLSYRLHVREVC